MNDAGAAAADEELLQFLYALPIAAFRIGRQGRIDLMTPPAAARLQAHGLLDAKADGWQVLSALDARVAARAQSMLLTTGVVAEKVPVQFTTPRGQTDSWRLSVTVIEPGVLMVALDDAP